MIEWIEKHLDLRVTPFQLVLGITLYLLVGSAVPFILFVLWPMLLESLKPLS